MKKVLNNSVVPPGGGWTYINPEDNHHLTHPYFNVLYSKAIAYRKTNNYPVGLQFEDEFDNNVCNQAAPNVCIEYAPPTLGERLSTLTQALIQNARSGFKVVDETEYHRRLAICEVCNFFTGTKGLLKIMCKSCGCAGLKVSLSKSSCPINKW